MLIFVPSLFPLILFRKENMKLKIAYYGHLESSSKGLTFDLKLAAIPEKHIN